MSLIRLLLAVVMAFAAPVVGTAARAEVRLVQAGAEVVGGTYTVNGTNPNGSTYSGTVVIKVTGEVYRFSWLIANGDTFKGTGTRRGNTLIVNWGQKDPVIYEIAGDGILNGTWAGGKGSETLVPKR